MVSCSKQGQEPELVQEGEPFVIEGEITGVPRLGIIELHDAWDGWTPVEPASTGKIIARGDRGDALREKLSSLM